jgi:dTDP-4-amino-4,6-dideoxygalactose transaminase
MNMTASVPHASVGPTPTLPYGRHWIDDDDIAAVVRALRSDWLTTGPGVADFERGLADFVVPRRRSP